MSTTAAPAEGRAMHAIRTGLPPWWVEFAIVAVGYLGYQAIQILVTGSETAAVARAEWIWEFERALNIDMELWLNQMVAPSSTLVLITGLLYGLPHFLITPAVLIWLRVRRRMQYPALRNTLILTSLVALVIYWIMPLAPPRLSIDGFVDTLKVGNILSAADPTGPASMANQYAAMPSLHVAWAVWVGLALVVAHRGSRGWLWAWAYPFVTTIVVMATANHFIVDAIAGAVIVWGAWLVCRPAPPPRPSPALVPAS